MRKGVWRGVTSGEDGAQGFTRQVGEDRSTQTALSMSHARIFGFIFLCGSQIGLGGNMELIWYVSSRWL